MDIAFRARDGSLRNLENFSELRRIQISRRGWLDISVATLSDQRRKPADLQLQSHTDQEIGVTQLQQEAGFGIDKVRILIAPGQRLNINLVAANFLGKRREVRKRSNHLQILRGCCRRDGKPDA